MSDVSNSSDAAATATPQPSMDGSMPPGSTAVLVLSDGTVFWGRGIGAVGTAVGEVCFNTSLTGYQEVLTDPSYAGQIITFTFPHIGNVGANAEDMETRQPAARGCVLRADITEPANWRAQQHLDEFLKANNLVGIAGIDTRRLTRRIRDGGAPGGAVFHSPESRFDLPALHRTASSFPGLEGMDLAREVTCDSAYGWDHGQWTLGDGFQSPAEGQWHVVAVDFGAKHNILRCLVSAGCRVTVVPAMTSAKDILALAPDGVFLSNGPGDPAATGHYAVPMVQQIMDAGLPVFGICLGHQILALALGAKTYKMHLGHRGGNQPVKDLSTDKVEITSQNHGFVVDEDSLPSHVRVSHRSLFDGSVEGLAVDGKPVFSVQYHPEASPGPHDSHYLFKRFVDMIRAHRGS